MEKIDYQAVVRELLEKYSCNPRMTDTEMVKRAIEECIKENTKS